MVKGHGDSTGDVSAGESGKNHDAEQGVQLTSLHEIE